MPARKGAQGATDAPPKAPKTNMPNAGELLRFIERIEAIRAEKRALGDDEKAVLAEAKAAGFNPAIMNACIKRRAAKPHDVQDAEAQLDIYLHALGLANEPPLFRYMRAMAGDAQGRDSLIAGLMEIVPPNGEIIVKVGGEPVRIWRDKDGDPQSAPYEVEVMEPKDPAVAAYKKALKKKDPPPDVDAAGARELGRAAAKENRPVIENPFPFDDKRRPAWDEGWRSEAGSDGMGPPDDGE